MLETSPAILVGQTHNNVKTVACAGPPARAGSAGIGDPRCCPVRFRQYEAMVRQVELGDWGTLVVYDQEEPEGLHGAERAWRGDTRRRPVQLQTKVGVAAYVAVWPPDRPPPPEGPLTREHLEGVALASPVTHHRCFVCGAGVSGLYVDGGANFFDLWSHPHEWIRACPACGADVTAARLSGMLPSVGA